MQYLGDYAEDYATLNFKFHSRTLAQVPATLSGTPAISVYKANSTTQSTAGITLSVDFDSVTGLNNVLIDLSADAFYAVSNDYQVVITAGTVDSISVVGTVLAHFSIENRFNEVDVTKLGGATQSATDLKDLADSGYDPSTHRISADATAISGDSTAADNLESACDNYSATRGLAGTALPDAAANAANGIPVSIAGNLNLDAKLAHTEEVTAARMGALTDLINDGRLDLIFDAIKIATDKMNFTGTYINAQIKASDNIDFGALQKTSLNAATPASITGAVGSVTGNVGGNVAGSVGSVVATVSANLVSILGTALTETAGYLAAGFKKFFNVQTPVLTVASVEQTKDTGTLHDFNPASDTVASVTLVDTCTTNTDMRGTNGAYTGTPPTVNQIQSGLAKTTEISALNNISVADILAAETESGLTLKHAMQIITALALKASGGGTTSITFRNYGDTKNRLSMTVDEDGNRTAVTVSFD
jgi:hypothetical protein